MGDKVLFYAYASCMFKQHMDRPSAKLKTIAKLENYSLDFADYVDKWHGCYGTLVNGGYCWGCVWEMDAADFEEVAVQENVPGGKAKVLEVEVVSPKGEKIKCKCFQRISKDVPKKPLPSPQYLDLIIRGGLQNGVPDEYINKIKMIETNHNSEKVPAYEESMMRLFKRR